MAWVKLAPYSGLSSGTDEGAGAAGSALVMATDFHDSEPPRDLG